MEFKDKPTPRHKPKDLLVEEYAEKIRPLLELARRAYGSRDQDTPAHVASREYTRLLVEFNNKGGSLAVLANVLSVSYSGVRRRVFTSDVPVTKRKRTPAGTITVDDISRVAETVTRERAISTASYHRALYEAFQDGIPMNLLARKLGISNAAPLYYGVQAHAKRVSSSGAA